ncbi:unnamed protein product [Orchesella dallaii]|uniref:Gustatory receptor n=1 Tax=Orchesella dallaii TaxID=48710 RepID=A0ABP1QKQ0_9HEXA
MSNSKQRSVSWILEAVKPRRIDVKSGRSNTERELDRNSEIELYDVLQSIEDRRTTTQETFQTIQDDIEIPISFKSKHFFEYYFDILHCLGLAAFKKTLRAQTSICCLVQQAPAIVLGVASILLAIVKTAFGSMNFNDGWSLSASILEESYTMSLSLFIWTSNSTTLEKQSIILDDTYASEIDGSSLSLGITGGTMKYFGYLLDYVIGDIMLLTTITLYQVTKNFTQKLKEDCSQRGSIYFDDVLKHYERLQNLNISIEESFSVLFKISHAANLISCAYFLLKMTSDTIYNISWLLLMLQIFKILMTYCVAAITSNMVQPE